MREVSGSNPGFDVFIFWNSFSIALHFPKFLLPALYFLLCLSFSVRFFYLLVSYLFPSSCLFVYSILGDFSLLTVVYVTGFSFSCLLVCVWSVSSLSAIWVESLSVFIHGYVVWFSSSCVGRSSISACWGLGCRVSFSVFRFGSESESVYVSLLASTGFLLASCSLMLSVMQASLCWTMSLLLLALISMCLCLFPNAEWCLFPVLIFFSWCWWWLWW